MKWFELDRKFIWAFMFVGLVFLCSPNQASAYIGPGTGLSAIGALIAVVLGVLIAIFGFLWYPLKRILKKKDESADVEDDEEDE